MRDIHHYEQRLISSLKGTESLSKNNETLIKDFIHKCELEEISKCRLGKYAYLLGRVSEWLGKDLNKTTKKDIEDLVLKIKNEYTNEWTIKDYKVVIRKFYRSIGKEDLVSWIKITIKKNLNQNLPNEVYSLEEIDNLIEAGKGPLEKALVSVLYDSGCRISELLNIKIKDISFEEGYAMVNVMGKTGNREIPISKSVPYLSAWINYSKRDKEEYLFPMTYRKVAFALERAFKIAGIDKPFNPHQFRHSRATELAKNLTEAQMNQFFGWSQNSDMARVYVHLSGRDLIPKLVMENKARKCLKCGTENPMDLKFCSKCLMPLDSKQFKEREKDRKYEELAYEVSKDPRYTKLVLEIAMKKGLVKKA